MKDLLVVTGSSLPPSDPRTGMLSLYLIQLSKADIDTHLVTHTDVPTADGGAPGTLEFFIQSIRSVAHKFSEYERLIITDGWDVVFFGNKSDVIRNIPMDKCLIGAAKECYPWNLAVREPASGDTNRLYTNGGMLAGTPEHILRLADAMATHPRYRHKLENQGMMNIMLAENTELFYHDNKTELFFTLYDGYPELDFENGIPVNTLYGTHPAFLHANGHWDTTEMFEKWERSLK